MSKRVVGDIGWETLDVRRETPHRILYGALYMIFFSLPFYIAAGFRNVTVNGIVSGGETHLDRLLLAKGPLSTLIVIHTNNSIVCVGKERRT